MVRQKRVLYFVLFSFSCDAWSMYCLSQCAVVVYLHPNATLTQPVALYPQRKQLWEVMETHLLYYYEVTEKSYFILFFIFD